MRLKQYSYTEIVFTALQFYLSSGRGDLWSWAFMYLSSLGAYLIIQITIYFKNGKWHIASGSNNMYDECWEKALLSINAGIYDSVDNLQQ